MYPVHDPSTCHRCNRGRVEIPFTESDRREIANDLLAQGFRKDYLAHRYQLGNNG